MSLCSFYLPLCFVLQSYLHQPVVLGSPIASNTSSGHKSFLASRTIYPRVDEIRKAFHYPGGAFVFMTQYENYTDAANQFIEDVEGFVLQDAYPLGYLKKRGGSDDDYQSFIDRASKIHAKEAVEHAYVLTNWDYVVDACRTFNRIILPSLFFRRQDFRPAIHALHLVDYSNTSNQRQIWPFEQRPNKWGLPPAAMPKGLTNPSGPGKDDLRCYDWSGYGEDPSRTDFHPKSWRPYMPGVCGVHVTQYQRNEKKVNPSPNYTLNITVTDSRGQTIGQVKFADAPNGVQVNVKSSLPKVLSARALSQDDDPILFNYGDHSWNTATKDCKVGKYDSGKREMDCGFKCK